MHKASVEERLKLKRMQIDTWSTREQLCLASSVLRSGDQNWVSVSRAVKVLGDSERPQDWFSQKNCALQYARLLENVETPKRKRGDKGEETKAGTPGECIVQKLTLERLDELKKLLNQERSRYKRLKEEVLELSSGKSDHRLAEISLQIEGEKKQKEEDRIAHEKRLKEREEKIIEIQRAFRPQVQRKSLVVPRPPGQMDLSIGSDTEMSQDSPFNETANVDIMGEESPVKNADEKPASTPTSPLLTSLLKSPSPAPSAQASILHSAITAQRAAAASSASSTPTISSLLASSPTKREGAPATSFSPGLSNLVTSAIAAGGVNDIPVPADEQQRPQTLPSTSPSAGAPTLSMLLELPPSVPGTPLPELPAPTMAPALAGASNDETLIPVQPEQQVIPAEIETKQLVLPDTTVPHMEIKKEPSEEKLAIPGVQKIPETVRMPLDTTVSVQISTAVANEESKLAPVPVVVGTSVADLKHMKAGSHPLQPTLVLPEVTGLDTTEDDKQLEKMVTEMKAEERPTEKESVLEELPQEVVALIEEVEMAEEAQQQQQMQQLQLQQIQQQQQKQEEQQKIQEIQQELASTAEVLESTPTEIVPKAVEIVEKIPSPMPLEAEKEIVEEKKEEEKEEEAAPDEVEAVVEPEVVPDDIEKKTELIEAEEKTEAEPVESPADEEVEEKEEEEEEEEVEQEEQEEEEQEQEAEEEDQEEKEEEEEEDESVAEPFEVKSPIPALPSPPPTAPTVVITKPEEEKEEEALETVAETDEEQPNAMEHETSAATSPVEQTSTVQEDDAEDEIPLQQLQPQAPAQQQQTPVTKTRGRRQAAAAVVSMPSTPSTPIDSVPNSPASVGISATDEEKEYRAWKKSILLIWARLAAHKNASIFLKPITNEQVPGYHNIVLRPTDLTTIKRNIESGNIRSTKEFQHELMLMFLNAVMYNASNHEISKMARDMETDCLNHIQLFVTAQESVSRPQRRETRETNKRHDTTIGDGEDSEASRSAAPSPLPYKRKRMSAAPPVTNEERGTKKRRLSVVN